MLMVELPDLYYKFIDNYLGFNPIFTSILKINTSQDNHSSQSQCEYMRSSLVSKGLNMPKKIMPAAILQVFIFKPNILVLQKIPNNSQMGTSVTPPLCEPIPLYNPQTPDKCITQAEPSSHWIPHILLHPPISILILNLRRISHLLRLLRLVILSRIIEITQDSPHTILILHIKP